MGASWLCSLLLNVAFLQRVPVNRRPMPQCPQRPVSQCLTQCPSAPQYRVIDLGRLWGAVGSTVDSTVDAVVGSTVSARPLTQCPVPAIQIVGFERAAVGCVRLCQSRARCAVYCPIDSTVRHWGPPVGCILSSTINSTVGPIILTGSALPTVLPCGLYSKLYCKLYGGARALTEVHTA